MSQARVSIPFDLIDDPRVKPDHTHLWTRLEVLRLRQKSDVVQLTEGCEILRHLSGFMLPKVDRLLADLTKFGYLQVLENRQVNLISGAKYSGKETIAVKEPVPNTPTTKKVSESSDKPKEKKTDKIKEWLSQSMTDFSDIKHYWNVMASELGLAEVQRVTEKRTSGVIQRLQEKEFPGPDELYQAIKDQPFLYGDSDNGWKCDFEWIFCCKGNWVKAIERNYVRDGPVKKTSDGGPELPLITAPEGFEVD